jgi:hypothetical protein
VYRSETAKYESERTEQQERRETRPQVSILHWPTPALGTDRYIRGRTRAWIDSSGAVDGEAARRDIALAAFEIPAGLRRKVGAAD